MSLDFLASYVERVEKEIRNLPLPGLPASLYDPQRYVLQMGGKRIRPVFTLLACGLCGGDTEDAMPAALSVELLHNFTLIHDDIMDQASSRRGVPAVHKKWDTSTAILSGDGMYTQALMLLHRLPDSVAFKKVSALFLDGINHVCEGQALDMEFESREDVSTDEYLTMIAGKTAALISTSLQIGGAVAGAGSETLGRLDQLGVSLGLAFQVQDDLLDVVADPEKFGKKEAGDIYEAKKTWLMTSLFEACNKEEKKWLLNCLKESRPTDEDVKEVIGLYKKYHILESARTTMNRYYTDAEEILELFAESDYKQDLYKLIQTLKAREY